MRNNQGVDRNYEIHSDRSKMKGINYIEIGQGRYSDKDWGKGSIFINEDSFIVIEGIIKRHFKKYIHAEINNISRTKGRTIVDNLQEAGENVLGCTGSDILKVIEYHYDRSPKTINEFIKAKNNISKMLIGLGDYMDNAYEYNDWICIVVVYGN
jgi:hypothetical protein